VQSALRFRPYYRPMVWGGRRLASVFGASLPTSEPYGEAWVVSDHPAHGTAADHGEHAGRTLRELMESHVDALLGDSPPLQIQPGKTLFPWLVKFIDASDWLSVQVHPDEESVRRLWPGEGPKTEAWFVLATEPGSRVYAGLLPGVGERELRAAVKRGNVQDCLHQFEPQPGDCLYLPAGTVHAVGGGVLFAEVQQTSDATFRLFDWNRVDAAGKSRTLHIEEAMACIDWRAGPVQPVRAEGYPTSMAEMASTNAVRQSLVRCRHFHLEYVRQVRPFHCGGTGLLQVVIALHGGGSLRTAAGPQRLGPGETLVLPAGMPEVWCHPEGPLGVLVATLPPQLEWARAARVA
jgi:mannose-6-phosphate isomerase